MPPKTEYPKTTMGRAAEMLGGYQALATAISEAEGRDPPRSRQSINRMAKGEYEVPEGAALAMEKVTHGKCRAADYYPWLGGMRIRRAA